ncbi:MAG: hypothetical protein ACXQT1_03450, partial [Methermicoccaceae archaeon]
MSEEIPEQKRAVSKELYYSVETSITMLTMGEKLKWYKGKVLLGHDHVQLTNPEYSINLEDIQIVGREVPPSCTNSIFKATHQSAHLLVEYNKMGKLGLMYSAQTLFAGPLDAIEELKLHFKESVPDKVWGDLGISGDELRLLYLLFCGIADMRVLVPMFGDINTLEKLFQTLIKKKLITSNGDLTKDGLTHITKESEGVPAAELGAHKTIPTFDRFFSVWKGSFSGRYSKAAKVKVSILLFGEPLTGFIKVPDLWYVLKVL